MIIPSIYIITTYILSITGIYLKGIIIHIILLQGLLLHHIYIISLPGII